MAFSFLTPTQSFPSMPSASVDSWLNFLQGNNAGSIKSQSNINGFIFDYAIEDKIDLRADITDHYVEDNIAIQDHIAIRPVKITLRGLIGELAIGEPTGLYALLNSIQNGLTSVPAYLGGYTVPGLAKVQGAISQAQSVTNKISNAVSQGKSIYKLFQKSVVGRTKQQKAYNSLEALFLNRQPFQVQTPYKTFGNMVIESILCNQGEGSKYLSDITVTLKQIRFASVTVSAVSKERMALAKQQTDKAEAISKGTQSASLAQGLSDVVSKLGSAFTKK